MIFQHDEIYHTRLNTHKEGFEVFRNYNKILTEPIIQLIDTFARPKKYIFSELKPSTLSAQGVLSNVYFHEEDLIFSLQPYGRIMKMECNYGISHNPNYKEPEAPQKKSNRGRKPKGKKKKNRKTQGNGMFFNSQMSFWVSSATINNKIYKVKVFRNGTLEIPGVLDPKMTDAHDVAEIVKNALHLCLLEDIQITELYSIMRNYKFHILSDGALISMNKLKDKFIHAMNTKHPSVKSICQIKYNSERYPGLIVKFSTPIPSNSDKTTTIKMFQSGKVNIDGAISEYQALHYYNLLNDFYLMHINDIMYIPKPVDDSSSGYDTCSSDDEEREY